jgi:hypothetical protein
MSGRSLPDRKRVKPEDFMHKPSEEKAQTEQDQKAFLQGLGGFK